MMKRDLRKYSRQTITRLLIGAIIMIFVIGIGLISIFYGPGAAGMGFTCLLMGLIPVALIIIILWIIELIVKKNRTE